MAIVQGVAYWTHVPKPNTRFEPVYSVDLVVDQETAQKLEQEGLNVKEDDRGLVCVFKRKVYDKNGKERPAPALVDAKKQPFNGTVGNGSTVNVQYRPFAWTFGNKKGISADLIGIQVLELNEYAEDKIDFEEEDGFEAEAVMDEVFGDDDVPFNQDEDEK